MKYFILSLLLIGSSVFAAEPKDWTVFLFVNGDNNLCNDARLDIKEMQSQDVSNVANIVVMFDCAAKKDSKLIEIRGKQQIVLNEGYEADMGDWKYMTDTANMVFDKYPSKKRMLVVWNHGAGWRSPYYRYGIHRGISYDDQSGNHISTIQLGQAMAEITKTRKIDILGYDACLMQMIEVGYEVSNSNVDYILASEETEPGAGWDYTKLVASLAAKPTPVQFGKDIIDGFSAYYQREKVTLSLVSTQGIEKLAKSFKLISDDSVFARATGFYYRDYKDIGSAISLMKSRREREDLAKAYSEAVVYSRSNIVGASGLSIYYSPRPEAAYFNLRFAIDTGWMM